MTRLPTRSTRTDTLFPYTTLCRSRRIDTFLKTRDVRVGRAAVLGEEQRPARPQDPAQFRQCAAVIVHRAQRESAHHGVEALVAERDVLTRSEEHTSELQSLMRISYAVFCFKKKNKYNIYKPS